MSLIDPETGLPRGWEQPVNVSSLPARALTDIGNAERLVDRHGDDLRYVHAWGAWLAWDGRRWRPDDTGEAMRRAKEAVTAGLLEEALAEAGDRRSDLMKFAGRSQSAAKVRAALDLAQSDPRVVVRPAELDADPLLLNLANGTLNLSTGALQPHDRRDLITRIANVHLEAAASAPQWVAAVERWLPDPEVRRFVQRLCGHALSGDASEHMATVFYGPGANGKSVLLRSVLDLLGDYGLAAAPELLIAYRRPGGASPEVAELEGRRLVAALETDEGAPLAESRVKALTGGDRAKGRALYRGYVEIVPTWTLILATNHLPRISGQDEAIWRRIALVPFDVTIPEAERDPRLVERLAEERPGILAWALEGYREWAESGLMVPTAVRAATAAYRADEDPLGGWLADCCETDPDARAPFGDLWASFENYCGGRPTLRRSAFATRLKDLGHDEERGYLPDGRRVRFRKGIALAAGAS